MKKRKTNWVRNWGIVLSIVVVLGALIWFQFNRSNQDRLAQTPTYTIERGQISLVSLATGKLSSAEEVRIRVSGTVTSLEVSLGQTVEKNQILAEYQRQSTDTEVLYATSSGIVTQIPSAINPKLLIATLNQMQIEFNVSEFDRNRFILNQAAEIYVEAIDTTFYGSISKVSEVSLLPTAQYTITALFDNAQQKALIGMSAVAKVELEGYGAYYAHGKLSAANPIEIQVKGNITQSFVQVGDRVQRNTKILEYLPSSSKQVLRSSSSGIVTQIPGALGNEFVIGQIDQLQLVINIAETDIHKIELNQPADIYIEAIDQSFTGQVTEISNVGNTNLDYTTYPVTIDFDSGSAPLFIGMSASARITIETKSDILVVPFEALISEGTNRYVISAEWLDNSNQPRSDYYIPVRTGIADVYTIEVIGDNLLNQEIIIIEASAGLPFFGPNR